MAAAKRSPSSPCLKRCPCSATFGKPGCLFLVLTGGEVLSSPKLFPVLDRARELNLAVQLLTNGTLLRPGVAAKLAGYPNLMGASVSLYGATPETHDGITQVRGSWRRTWDGIERLRGLGVAVRLKFVVMRQNAHEVASMRADADARQLTYVLDTVVTARNDGSDTSLATRIEDDQLRALYRGPLRDLVPDERVGSERGELPLQLRPGKLRDYRHGGCDPVHFRALGGGQRPRAEVRRHLALLARLPANSWPAYRRLCRLRPLPGQGLLRPG